MRKLHLMFKNADGSKKTLIIHLCQQNLAPEFVKTIMEELIALKLFERNGVQLCTEIIGAKYVEKKVTPLFDRLQFLKKRSGVPSQQKLIAAELEEMPDVGKGEQGELSSSPEMRNEENKKLESSTVLDMQHEEQEKLPILSDTKNKKHLTLKSVIAHMMKPKEDEKLVAALAPHTENQKQAKLTAKLAIKSNQQKTSIKKQSYCLLFADTENSLKNVTHPRKALLRFSKKLNSFLRQSSNTSPNFLKKGFPVLSSPFSIWITQIADGP